MTMNGGSSPRVRGTRTWCSNAPPRPPVHPRVCGELEFLVEVHFVSSGSSPRVRGTRICRCRQRHSCRFIPACAGNSIGLTPVEAGDYGSSPRVRGTRARDIGPHRRRRFIPACAGNSRTPTRALCASSVHPRVCGELLRRPCSRRTTAGSSPRVRGTPGCGKGEPQYRRFIPACAGNSATASRSRCRSPVHPRVCGELRANPSIGVTVDGSSPRVRGTRRPPDAHRPRARFIPACAGNSMNRRPPTNSPPVHPRVCGELCSSSTSSSSDCGSSPRVRGTPAVKPVVSCSLAVHPRVCGELVAGHRRSDGDHGSSPRVRGTRPVAPRRRRRTTVHPRVCGELLRPTPILPSAAGSSPRVRGTHRRVTVVPKIISVHPRVCGELFSMRRSAVCRSGSSPRVRGTRTR